VCFAEGVLRGFPKRWFSEYMWFILKFQ